MDYLFVLTIALGASASSVLQLNGTSYYTPDVVFASLPCSTEVKVPTPFTYLTFSDTTITSSILQAKVSEFLETDDVFSPSFLETVYVTSTISPEVELAQDAKDYLTSVGCKSMETIYLHSSVASGPYILHPSGSITKVYRLYADPQLILVTSVTAGPNDTYDPITAAAPNANGGATFAVPSKLYYPAPTIERPLEGKRLVVKDIYDLKGIRTTGGSRGFHEISRLAAESGPALQRLIDLGAVVVGKSKTTVFALGEKPTSDYIDQIAPFNPRGDGYQNPQGSSSGTGAGVASYDFIDFGTGSDTGGSVRLPAMANGIYGMRISNASLLVDGILPISAAFDTPGLLTRDAKLMKTSLNTWFKSTPYKSYPKRVIMPTEFWPTVNGTSMDVFDYFISNLTTFLNATVESVNTNSSFKAFTGHSEGLQAYMGPTYPNITAYDQYNRLAAPFAVEYEAKFGYKPFWNPVARSKWTWGALVTQQDYDNSKSRVAEYQAWFRSQLVPTCEEALVIFPMGAGIEDYRDVYHSAPLPTNGNGGFGSAYSHTLQSVFAGVPDYTIPIGVRKYFSRVTQQEEELPVTLGIISAANCEGMLADLVVELGEKIPGIVTKVFPGKKLYELEPIPAQV